MAQTWCNRHGGLLLRDLVSPVHRRFEDPRVLDVLLYFCIRAQLGWGPRVVGL
jgi:hypothetical protein